MNKLDLEETTRRFHNVYEQVAKEYGYKTREDTKELDFNSPNGMTMLKTIEMITTPYLEEIERLNNIIYTTLEYVDREEINSIGTPYTYTERGKHIKELLEGERTFNSLWQENKRLNNIISELEDLIESAYNWEGVSFQIKVNGKWDITEDMEEVRKYIQELKGEDKE